MRSLDVVDVELVRFEQDPNNAKILANIFRLVHTIKGTCGFLGLPRLEALAHAAETLMGKFRDGLRATGEAVTLILATIDRIKEILELLERDQREPDGTDDDLIAGLHRLVEQVVAPATPAVHAQADGVPQPQVLERRQRPGEATLDELDRVFRETAPEPSAAQPAPAEAHDEDNGKASNQSIRVAVDSLEKLMTMVSELVLTRNQLLEIVRRHEDFEFKAPLQRLSSVTAELQEGVMKTRMQPIGNAWQKLPRIVRDLAGELASRSIWNCTARKPNSTARCSNWSRTRSPTWCAIPPTTAWRAPASARAAGKPEHGRIRLSAYHEGGHIVIQIADDGRGLSTATDQGQGGREWACLRGGDRQRCRKRKSTNSSSCPAFPPPPKSPACPAAASAWTWCAPISTRSAARST